MASNHHAKHLLAMSVSLIGMSLRALGCSRVVVWPFFIASVILMLAWKPKLEQGTLRA